MVRIQLSAVKFFPLCCVSENLPTNAGGKSTKNVSKNIWLELRTSRGLKLQTSNYLQFYPFINSGKNTLYKLPRILAHKAQEQLERIFPKIHNRQEVLGCHCSFQIWIWFWIWNLMQTDDNHGKTKYWSQCLKGSLPVESRFVLKLRFRK